MRILYITEPGAYLTLKDNKLEVKKDKTAVIQSCGIELIEGIIIIGNANLSSGLATALLEREITVTWLSTSGKFFGRLESTTGYNIERIMQQFKVHNDQKFRLEISKKWINAKIKNNIIVLRRYNRNRNIDKIEEIIENIEKLLKLLAGCNQIDEVMGYEGSASRLYFEALPHFLSEEFKFKGRSKRPPRDPFNSLLSFGYTLLLYEIYTVLAHKNLQPFLGFMHQPRRGHPALASDLMEEWRGIIVDSLALKMLTNNQLKMEDFQEADPETGGVYLNRESSKNFISQFETRVRTENKYSNFVDYPVTYRESLSLQINGLVKAIEMQEPDYYKPMILR